MALIQVLYNNAMRLGQGFNTYNQKIAIDNAVIGITDPEDSQPIDPTPDMPVLVDGKIQPPPPESMTTGPKRAVSEDLPPIPSVTHVYPSQIVTYTSKYVNKLSDVTSNMNISASLSIQYGEIKGSGAGSYVDSNTFQSSDMNFIISVNVINQTINVKDQLQFWPLSADTITEQHRIPANINSADFTSVYGDSFISGFQEGGQFFAIVSITALNSADKMEIKANAQLALNIGAGSLAAKGDVDDAKANLQKNAQVDITVNWSGGGQLKQGPVWDIDSLTAVAVQFPDLVALCPQRTAAIITKYTALRGYLEWKAKAASIMPPLDYELASLYTSDLLDVFMGYKVIWDNLHTMMDVMSAGTIVYVKTLEPTPAVFTPEVMVTAKDGTTSWQAGTQLHPFDNNVAGLDSAVQQCRMLMIRLVQEVNALNVNPALAVEPLRPVAYLRPQLFQQLLPVVGITPTAGSAVTGAKSLVFPAMDSMTTVSQSVTTGYPTSSVPPSVIFGLSRLDMNHGVDGMIPNIANEYRLFIRASATKVDVASAVATATVTPDVAGAERESNVAQTPEATYIPAHAASFITNAHALAVAQNNAQVQAGTWTNTWQDQSTDDLTGRVNFLAGYASPPQVMVWLAGFDRHQDAAVDIFVSVENIDIFVSVENIDGFGFTIRAHAANPTIYQASVSWLAFPANAKGIACGNSAAPTTVTPPAWTSLRVTDVSFPQNLFVSPPKVLVAMSGFSFGAGQIQLRLQTADINVTAQGFTWQAGTWADSQFIDASVGWVAIAQ